MKKFIIGLIVVVLLLALTLGAVACSNVNQINFISVVARDYERYVYVVCEKDNDTTPIGTFTYTFKRLLAYEQDGQVVEKAKYTIADKEYEFVSGGIIMTQLDITQGKYAGENVSAEVLFQDAFSPIASRKVYNAYSDGEKDEARSYTAVFDYVSEKKAVCYTINGGEQKSFKKPNYCYDNDSLYSLVRGSDISRSSYSLSVAGVDNLQGGTRTVSMGLSTSTLPINVPAFDKPIETKSVQLSVAAKYGSSTSTTIYFLPSHQLEHADGTKTDLNKIPVRIDEGNYIYLLQSISVQE